MELFLIILYSLQKQSIELTRKFLCQKQLTSGDNSKYSCVVVRRAAGLCRPAALIRESQRLLLAGCHRAGEQRAAVAALNWCIASTRPLRAVPRPS